MTRELQHIERVAGPRELHLQRDFKMSSVTDNVFQKVTESEVMCGLHTSLVWMVKLLAKVTCGR